VGYLDQFPPSAVMIPVTLAAGAATLSGQVETSANESAKSEVTLEPCENVTGYKLSFK
jgi:hypothetical protein